MHPRLTRCGSAALFLLCGLLLAAPRTARAECGSQFEICGNGIDDDCDGAIDEGCTLCTYTPSLFPYVMDSISEIRNETNNRGFKYGTDTDRTWYFVPSHRVTGYGLRFGHFDTESTNDYLAIDGGPYSGVHTPPYDIPPGGTQFMIHADNSPIPFRWHSNASVFQSGFQISNFLASCNSGGGLVYSTIQVNQGYDGALLYSYDDAFVKFTLPANTPAYINMDMMGTSANFDLYVSTSNSVRMSCSGGGVIACGTTTSATGEAIAIAQSSQARTLYLTIHSASGRSRQSVCKRHQAASLLLTVFATAFPSMNFLPS